MKFSRFMLIVVLFFSTHVYSSQGAIDTELADLKNFQANTPKMVSSGLPNKAHFEALEKIGVTTVIDLIPGDRSEELALISDMSFNYHNIPVIWKNPTLDNFKEYVSLMKIADTEPGKTLTHCRLNWRGATFTYLYRVTQLNEDEALAKQDMLSIWQPDDVWQAFIDQVKAEYK